MVSPFHGIFSASLSQQLRANAQKESSSKSTQPAAGALSPQVRQGQVALDVYEFDNYYILKAPIAGVKLADLSIEIADNVLIIRGNRKQTDAIPSDQYYLRECFWGDFSRSVTFPFPIDPKRVKATFNKDSILKILIPKEERVKIVRIHE